jgi:hypothetical protein
MTLSRMFNKYVRSGLSVEDSEVRSYYNRNLKSFSLPEEIRVRDSFFRLPENASPATTAAVREKAAAALARARKGEDFIRLVKELSKARLLRWAEIGLCSATSSSQRSKRLRGT